MKMKIDPLKKGSYGFHITGEAALRLIMDNKTPKVDLLVREAIQNSADATKKECDNCFIKFDTVDFNNVDLGEKIDVYGQRLVRLFGRKSKALIISDYNTTGLLGPAYQTDNGPNNLYKLVYAFLESYKSDSKDSGGSWGIGKTVYYRYGKGLVFYYTCTFENGCYNHKLAGALLEDAKNSNRIINNLGSDKYIGVAFLGKTGFDSENNTRSIPILNKSEIKDFLDVFGVDLYEGNETGTKIIIPYFDEENFLDDRVANNTDEQTENCYWENDLDEALNVVVQRWYFPKLNNYKVNKRISVFINGKPVMLLPFFSRLQELYNGQLSGQDKFIVKSNNFDSTNNELGYFHYKKMTKEELEVLTPPNNYPSPYCLLDIKQDTQPNSNESIIFYVRNSRMVITYSDSKLFTTLRAPLGEYIIGVFILNDYASKNGETLGEYFKESEAANHKGWDDFKNSTKLKEIPSLKSRPFSQIKKAIKNELNSKFGTRIEEEKETKNTRLQRFFGDFLLPPEDFGKEPKIGLKPPKDKPPVPLKKREKRIETTFDEFKEETVVYCFDIMLKEKEQANIQTLISTSYDKISFDEWDNLNFRFPCFIQKLDILIISIGNNKFNTNFRRIYDGSSPNLEKDLAFPDKENKDITIVKKMTKISKKVYGFKVSNHSAETIYLRIHASFKIEDSTLGIAFSNSVNKVGG